MTTPAVSVVLPTRNRARLLPGAIQSVLAQSHGNLELIVVDDVSTDDTHAVVAGFRDPRVRYLRLEQRRGAAGARNAGLGLARGRFLAFQDSDDEWLLDKLEIQLDAVHDVGICIAGTLRVTENRVRSYPDAPSGRRWRLAVEDVLRATATYVQSWLVPTDLVVRLGGFDERLSICEDWELLIRLSQAASIECLAIPVSISSKSEDSLTGRGAPWGDSIEYVLGKHAALFALHPAAHGHMRYLQARYLAAAGDVVAARRALRRTLSIDATRAKPWLMYGLSLLGAGAARRALNRVETGR